ncbi:IclR family transcriptional regulator [Sinosporangium siamense]|uniref:Transcriptional regulator n=1 Tax=Sinosporangium siamense TaxID=1367973 RepID=A0A919RNZ1_9ACTN|nr:helix-turn-helix domain-containing protein [Sinosporangium siamense]GII97073.1 transcriptional regulator [Sinosporangium siamense]
MAAAGRTEGSAEEQVSRRSVVQSVTRAFDVLHLLRDTSSPLSVQEIARGTGLDRTVVHRLLRSLLQADMVMEERGLFRVGPASVLLANRYHDDLLVRRLALPYMVELQAGEIADKPWTATLSIAVGNVSAVIERIWTPHTPLDLVLAVGDTFPIHSTASGRSMLAYYEPEKLVDVVGPELSSELAPILESARASGGIGLSRGEAVPGVEAISAVILSRRQAPVASISVSGVDLGDQMDQASPLASTLRRAAGAIGQMIP